VKQAQKMKKMAEVRERLADSALESSAEPGGGLMSPRSSTGRQMLKELKIGPRRSRTATSRSWKT
jgi:hypothetical protein